MTTIHDCRGLGSNSAILSCPGLPTVRAWVRGRRLVVLERAGRQWAPEQIARCAKAMGLAS